LKVQQLGHWIFDQAFAGLTRSRGVIKSPRTQPSIPLGYVNRVPVLLAQHKVG